MAYTSDDPVERIVGEALERAGWAFTTETARVNVALDFHVTRLNTHVEVKRFHTPRTGKQMERSDNIIVIVGIDAARAFAQMVAGTQPTN